ncbi:IS1 family transposase [Cardinium endosymbiont of Culicoides punctatus]|uniref:IS1 family transposase n=1 Tax=Cardinium endosymbiont of Culicoides punctatus TaxID=2304601 RepID=UPI001058BEE1|nr:IS1 family transposase [Cardinium endosymbiont of Culicoides punctatus]TDG95350.1 hypothetical protein CCPUN_04890 [Cardinium endosymbiont of Culicoides punctatus]
MEKCPGCLTDLNVVKNGLNKDQKQNYLCKSCKKQFIDRRALVYRKFSGNTTLISKIIKMLERGCSVRDIEYIEQVPRSVILRIIERFNLKINLKQQVYKSIQIDEMWSYVGRKRNKKWFIYALSPETGEILACVVGKRDTKTVKKLYDKIISLKVVIEEFCTDNWSAFSKVFSNCCHKIGKQFTRMIEGVNCLFRHRISRFVRKTCCFSKKLKNHINAIMIVIDSINKGNAWAK